MLNSVVFFQQLKDGKNDEEKKKKQAENQLMELNMRLEKTSEDQGEMEAIIARLQVRQP